MVMVIARRLLGQNHRLRGGRVEIIEGIPILGKAGLERIQYPQEAIHEIVTNAVIHRDYSINDDIHVRIFDNRIEVQSPGRLPAHITVKTFKRSGSLEIQVWSA
ncbi:MAG: ATP-binding protein [Actinomycetota bacterium]